MVEDTVVYWIHTENQFDPTSEGYVGITDDLKSRIHQHLRNPNKIVAQAFNKYTEDEIVFTVIFHGARTDCLALEEELRPNRGIGWNIAKGGIVGKPLQPNAVKGWKQTEAARKKISAAKLGIPFSAQHKSSISAGKQNMSAEAKASRNEKIRNRRLGSKQSIATINKRKATMSTLRWWNNGKESVRSSTQPDGWISGRVKWKTDNVVV